MVGSAATASTTPAISDATRRLLAHIPGEDGWPVIGNTLKILRDPVVNAETMYRRYGTVYRNRAFGIRTVVMLGPDANELVLLDRDRNFSSSGGWGQVLGRVFPRGLMLLDFDEHRLHRRALGTAFKAAPMEAYLSPINDRFSRLPKEWSLTGVGRQRAEIHFYPVMKQLVLDLAATAFLGMPLGVDADQINRAFFEMVGAATGLVRSPVPGTKMWKGVRAREVVISYLRKEIPQRRTGTGTDLFSELCRASKDDGSLLSEQEVVDHLSFLLMAAHDTLTSSVTSLLYLLATSPDWQDRIREEIHGLALSAGAALPYQTLRELPMLEMAYNEAIRLYPPVPAIPRVAVRDFDFSGHRIPAGTRVILNTVFTHRMPGHWPEPAVFDPFRFTPDAIRQRHKHAWVPYGGGAHMCLGLNFAYMLAKTFFYHLLPVAKLSVRPDYRPTWRMWPIPKPVDGLRISLEPL